MISRRTLLKLGTAGAALTAVVTGGGGLVLASWWDREAAPGYRCLSPEEAGFCRSLAEVAWPPSPQLPLPGAQADLDHYVDELVASMTPTLGKQFRLLLHLLDSLPRATRLASFQDLDFTAREEIMLGWLHSELAELRSGATSILLFLGMGYTTHPDNAPMFSRMYGCGYGR